MRVILCCQQREEVLIVNAPDRENFQKRFAKLVLNECEYFDLDWCKESFIEIHAAWADGLQIGLNNKRVSVSRERMYEFLAKHGVRWAEIESYKSFHITLRAGLEMLYRLTEE